MISFAITLILGVVMQTTTPIPGGECPVSTMIPGSIVNPIYSQQCHQCMPKTPTPTPGGLNMDTCFCGTATMRAIGPTFDMPSGRVIQPLADEGGDDGGNGLYCGCSDYGYTSTPAPTQALTVTPAPTQQTHYFKVEGTNYSKAITTNIENQIAVMTRANFCPIGSSLYGLQTTWNIHWVDIHNGHYQWLKSYQSATSPNISGMTLGGADYTRKFFLGLGNTGPGTIPLINNFINTYLAGLGFTGWVIDPSKFNDVTWTLAHTTDSNHVTGTVNILVEPWCYGVEPEPTPTPAPTQIAGYCSQYDYLDNTPVFNPNDFLPYIDHEQCGYILIPGQPLQQIGNVSFGWPQVEMCIKWVGLPVMEVIGLTVPMGLLILPMVLYIVSLIIRW